MRPVLNIEKNRTARGGSSRSHTLDGSVTVSVRSPGALDEKKDGKRAAEVADPKGSPEDKKAKEGNANLSEAEIGAQKLAAMADAGIVPGTKVEPGVSSSSSSSNAASNVASVVAALESKVAATPEASLTLSLPSVPSLPIVPSQLSVVPSDSQTAAELNADTDGGAGSGGRRSIVKTSGVQLMLAEMKRSNALVTNTVKGNREFMEGTLALLDRQQKQQVDHGLQLQAQQSQIADLLRVMQAGFTHVQSTAPVVPPLPLADGLPNPNPPAPGQAVPGQAAGAVGAEAVVPGAGAGGPTDGPAIPRWAGERIKPLR